MGCRTVIVTIGTAYLNSSDLASRDGIRYAVFAMSRRYPESSGQRCTTGCLRFSDIPSYAESLKGTWNLTYQQLRASGCEGSCRFSSDGTALVYEEVYPATAGLRGSVGDGLFAALLTNERGSAGRWQGRVAPTHAVAYADSRVEADVLMPEGARNLAVVMPVGQFRDLFERLAGESASERLPGDRLFHRLEPSARRRLEANWKGMLDDSRPAGRLGVGIVESLVRALDESSGCGLAVRSRAARKLYRRAMERCEADGLRISSPADLALAMGVSLRSLEMAFRTCMGIPPVRYLRRLRLNRAHDQLLRSDPGATSVTAVALDLGFTELGRFSGEYRRLFGELPSETLRCRRGGTMVFLPSIG